MASRRSYTGGLEKERARRGGRREATGGGIGLKEKKERGQRKWSELAKVYDRKGGHDRSSKQVSWPRLERPVPPSFSSSSSSSSATSFFSLSFSLSPVAVAFNAYARGNQCQNYTRYHSGYRDGRWSRIVATRNGYALRRTGPLPLLVKGTTRARRRISCPRCSKSRFTPMKKIGATKLLLSGLIRRQINYVYVSFPSDHARSPHRACPIRKKKIRTLGRRIR